MGRLKDQEINDRKIAEFSKEHKIYIEDFKIFLNGIIKRERKMWLRELKEIITNFIN